MRAPRRRAFRFTDEDQARLVELAARVQVHEEIVLANRVTAAVGRTIDPIAWRLHEMGYHVGFAVDDAANVGQPQAEQSRKSAAKRGLRSGPSVGDCMCCHRPF